MASQCWLHATDQPLQRHGPPPSNAQFGLVDLEARNLHWDSEAENWVQRDASGRDVVVNDSSYAKASILQAAGVDWDGAEKRDLLLTQELHFQDVFSVVQVPEDSVYNVNWVAGCIPVLRHYARLRLQGELDELDATMYAQTLNELNNFLFIDGIEQKPRQKVRGRDRGCLPACPRTVGNPVYV